MVIVPAHQHDQFAFFKSCIIKGAAYKSILVFDYFLGCDLNLVLATANENVNSHINFTMFLLDSQFYECGKIELAKPTEYLGLSRFRMLKDKQYQACKRLYESCDTKACQRTCYMHTRFYILSSSWLCDRDIKGQDQSGLISQTLLDLIEILSSQFYFIFCFLALFFFAHIECTYFRIYITL